MIKRWKKTRTRSQKKSETKASVNIINISYIIQFYAALTTIYDLLE